MGTAALENAIVRELRTIVNNPKLTKNSLMQWSTGGVTVEDGEIHVFLPELHVHVAIKRELDKR
jgi:hypothetical protein